MTASIPIAGIKPTQASNNSAILSYGSSHGNSTSPILYRSTSQSLPALSSQGTLNRMKESRRASGDTEVGAIALSSLGEGSLRRSSSLHSMNASLDSGTAQKRTTMSRLMAWTWKWKRKRLSRLQRKLKAKAKRCLFEAGRNEQRRGKRKEELV